MRDVATANIPPEDMPTDLEVLENYLAILVEQQLKGFNFWRQVSIDNLRGEAEKWYNSDGKRIDVEPEKSQLTVQFSPDEVLDASGWWTAYSDDIGRLPRALSRTKVDFSKGLNLSVARSNGSFLVQNQQETAEAFLDAPEEAAKKIGTTRRIVKMMGHILIDKWFMFPTVSLGAGQQGVGDYAIRPDVIFNNEEIRVWREMYYRYHFGRSSLAGANWQSVPLELYAGRPDSRMRERVDPADNYRVITVANHPQWIMPWMMDYYNSTKFKRVIWEKTVYLAHAIDRGEKARVPGYETPSELAGRDVTDRELFRWRRSIGEDTSMAGRRKMIWKAGSEIS